MGFGWGRGVPYKRGLGVEACSPQGKLVWRMSSEGEIRTCFISARLPSWAGVRQGVAGTNVNGGVVGAPAQSGVLAYSRFVQQQPGTAATGSVFRAVFPSVDLSAEVGMMRQALAELRQQLQELREVVDMQLRGTASEAPEEEEEEIVVDEEAVPGAGASTMEEEEEEDEMVLTLTVVGGPEPAGVEATPPPPPTPESDPAVPATTTTPSGAATEEQEERSMRGDN